jgi:sortase A
VLLAHDVSYFVHIDQLQTGDRISYRSPCTTVTYTVTGHRIVSQGSPVPDTPAPTLVLDTCYPPNALFFTSQRLLVQATESVVRTAAGPLTAASSGPPTAFRVNVPPALADQGLTLEQNEAPMGTMTLRGQPTRSWEQSPGPLNLEASALEAYFGGLHATHEQVPDWWEAIAPRVLPPQPLLGATITGHDSPLDVEIDASAGQPVAVVLRTTVTLSGGPAPGTYAEVVASRVTGSTLTVSRWGMSAT